MTPPIHNATAAVCTAEAYSFAADASYPEETPLPEKFSPVPASWSDKFSVNAGRILSFLFFPLFSMTGCSDGGAAGPTASDAETGCDPQAPGRRDRDGDGFEPPLDCDDCRVDVFPLREESLNEIRADATICPGIYRGARILIANRDSLTLNGAGVTVENSEALGNDEAILELRFANNVKVTGFSLRTAATALRLGASSGNTLEDLDLVVDSCAAGIILFASAGNTLQQVSATGPGSPLIVESGVQAEAGGRNIFEEFRGLREGGDCGEFAAVLRSGANRFTHSRFAGAPLVFEAPGANTFESGGITENLNNGYETGLVVFSSGNIVRDNTMKSNNVGIFIGRYAEHNEVVGNDLRGNADACLDIHPQAENNLVSENICDRP